MIWLIGAGTMAANYAKVLESLKYDFITIGRGESSAKKFQELTGRKVVSGGMEQYLEMKPQIPTHAIVCVNVESLFSIATELLEYGIKSILLEKPGGVDTKQIKELATISERQDARIEIAYNRRCYASVIKARELIEQDGGVQSFNFEFTEWGHVIEKLDKPSQVFQNWFLANSTHVVDLAFYLGGRPEQLSAYSTGSLPWHTSGAIFAGSGVSESGALFNYHANWRSAGRWSLEVLTDKGKYIMCPLEKLFFQKKGDIVAVEICFDASLDKEFKPGFYLQIKAFLDGELGILPALKEQSELLDWYSRIAGYHSV